MTDPPPPGSLQGRRLLLVEDEYLIADELRQALTGAGAEVLGPVPTVAEALALLATALAGEGRLDGAVLDLNLGGEMAFPVADALQRHGIPLVFTTGYDRDVIPPAYAHLPCCEKPAGARRVAGALGLL